jgi:hypothetical protein
MISSLKIEEAFYASYDPSVVHHYMETGRGLEKVGEGFFFEVFRYPGRAVALTLHIAKRAFFQEHGEGAAEWKRAFQVARKLRSPLIAPMELYAFGEKLGYVMPYCPVAIERPELTLAAPVRQFYDNLSAQGLVLGDCLQVRKVGEMPFQVDWSDLGFSSAKNGKLR